MTADAILGFGRIEREQAGPAPGFMQGSARHNLGQLVVMRNIAIAAQALTVVVTYRGLGIDLPLGTMALIIVALGLFNGLTWWRLSSERPVTDQELMCQLLVDVAALSLLLAMAGGGTNPFIGMLLLPLAITAACLPWTYTWVVALATVACYSLLVLFFRPLFAAGDEARFLQLLVAGMWVNYAITAGMIAHFVARVSMALRRSERQFASRRESEMCNEHLVRIGVLAAGAAHELAQPLSTVAVVINEIDRRCQGDEDLRTMLSSVTSQLRNCQETLNSLLSYGRTTFDGNAEPVPLDSFVRGALESFGTRRPDAKVRLVVDTRGPSPTIHHDLALRHAILNLLGNAADVSPAWVEVRLAWDAEVMRIAVRDRGPGIAAEVQQQVGRLFFTTKEKGAGNGLGLALARTAVTRLGGSLDLRNEAGGGACAEILLPVLEGFWPAPAEGAAR